MGKINTIEDLKYITFSSLEKYDNLFHCFTTRFGGISNDCYESMNLGMRVDDNLDNVLKNYEILSEKLNIGIDSIVKTHQTHTNNIRYVTEIDKNKLYNNDPGFTNVDGLITDKENISLFTYHADCTPIFFYDPVNRVIGMAHSGWKGTIKKIGANMIDEFTKKFNSDPKNIKIVIGPSLCQNCFEVDRDVYDIFIEENKDYKKFMYQKSSKYYFNLKEINKYMLLEKNVREDNIQISNMCTKCSSHMFFSHRSQGEKHGLMAGIMKMI